MTTRRYALRDDPWERIAQQGKTAVIPPKHNRKTPRDDDRDLYKARYLIESFFAKLKPYRAIATCYDKLAETFLNVIYMAGSVIWLI
jgi:transposase